MKAFEQIRAILEADIRRGRYPAQSTLPVLADLADEHGCAVGTVRRALDDLKQAGIVESFKKRGTVVLRPPAVGRVALLLANDTHTNMLFQGPICAALGEAEYDVDLLTPEIGVQAFTNWCTRLAMDPRPATALVVLGGDGPAGCQPAIREIVAKHFTRQVWVEIDGMDTGVGPTVSSVGVDWRQEALCLAEYVRDLGHRKVVIWAELVRGSEATRHFLVAEQFRDLFQMAGGQCALHFEEDSTQRLIRLIREQQATAYIDLNDFVAMGTLNTFLQAGLDVPGDVSLISRHDTPWAKAANPSLTSLSLNPDGTAAAVLQAVNDIAAGRGVGRAYHVMPRIASRRSTASPQPD